MPIPPISPNVISQTGLTNAGKIGQAATDQTVPGAFGSTLTSAIGSLNQMQTSSNQAIQKLAAGENVDLHQVMIGAEETDIAFRVALSMRDKLVEAYQEVMRMQV
jgi:flagellar hook-basal body complex protein FliE